ncbi:MAG: hypothetical protein DRO36_02900 [Candidatus Hecatellales archaeon]|nr:MAG: hypothetical protein DRO36_02900 [Candidatus Hecatellales archaeon]
MVERPLIKVRDVMKSPVVTVFEGDTALKTAKLMLENNIGSVVVVDLNRKPIGIITGKDLAVRVIAKKVSPSKAKNRDIMSHPVVIVSPDISLAEAAKRMKKFGVDRLLVIEEGEIVGIITSAEILEITPTLLEVAAGKTRTAMPVRGEETPLTGYCEVCGEWSDMLTEVSGKYVCEECRAELGGEET